MHHDAFELEVLPGLERICAEEAAEVLNDRRLAIAPRAGAIAIHRGADIHALFKLRCATAAYAVLTVPVPRPKGLLGHEHWTRLVSVCRDVLKLDRGFGTLSLDAAGAHTPVMQRIKLELADSLGLAAIEGKGDFHLRVRAAPNGAGWQVLVRLTARPLSTRPWRIHNYEGALNACIAAAMVRLANPRPSDRVLNVCCGSGTLMVEVGQTRRVATLLGVDVRADVLALSAAHLHAAGVESAGLSTADATAVPLPLNSVDLILADLPFGQRVGSHAENVVLYPALLAEAARVAVAGSRFVLITHEKRLLREIVQRQDAWRTAYELEINQNGLHPVIAMLERR